MSAPCSAPLRPTLPGGIGTRWVPVNESEALGDYLKRLRRRWASAVVGETAWVLLYRRLWVPMVTLVSLSRIWRRRTGRMPRAARAGQGETGRDGPTGRKRRTAQASA